MAIVEALFLIVFWSWAATAIFFLRTTFLSPQANLATPGQFQLPFETVAFEATDGTPLEGWTITADLARPWIIGCHGLGSNRSDLLEIAGFLHKAQFNVLLFDFRGHGGSSGHFTSFGLTEQRDLEGALAFLGQKTDIPPKPYGIYGISLGAAVALMVAARDERLHALALDGPYSGLESSINTHTRLMYPWMPAEPFLSYIRLTYRLRFGAWPNSVSPADSAAGLNKRPLLLITGSEDVRTPPAESEQIRKNHPSAEYWKIEGAGHLEGFGANPDKYAQRLTRFFSAHL